MVFKDAKNWHYLSMAMNTFKDLKRIKSTGENYIWAYALMEEHINKSIDDFLNYENFKLYV